jgi:hypothetical protein
VEGHSCGAARGIAGAGEEGTTKPQPGKTLLIKGLRKYAARTRGWGLDYSSVVAWSPFDVALAALEQ